MARGAGGAPVDFVAVQVLALIALDTSATFDVARRRLGLSRPHMSRALRSLRAADLIEEGEGQYLRDVLPPITAAGVSLLIRLIQESEG
jgi:hypothetical protein